MKKEINCWKHEFSYCEEVKCYVQRTKNEKSDESHEKSVVCLETVTLLQTENTL